MESDRFDALLRRLTQERSRRGAVTGLVGGTFALLGGVLSERWSNTAEANKGGKGHGRKGNGKKKKACGKGQKQCGRPLGCRDWLLRPQRVRRVPAGVL
jgi:hypothetical protein